MRVSWILKHAFDTLLSLVVFNDVQWCATEIRPRNRDESAEPRHFGAQRSLPRIQCLDTWIAFELPTSSWNHHETPEEKWKKTKRRQCLTSILMSNPHPINPIHVQSSLTSLTSLTSKKVEILHHLASQPSQPSQPGYFLSSQLSGNVGTGSCSAMRRAESPAVSAIGSWLLQLYGINDPQIGYWGIINELVDDPVILMKTIGSIE